jgi:hypothetical protein
MSFGRVDRLRPAWELLTHRRWSGARLRPRVKVGYEYDFGANSEHKYPDEKEPEEPGPFSLTDINRMLAALRR